MGEHGPRGFDDTPLDPAVLSTSKTVQTNWHVITGAASCGKTTLINMMAERGYVTVSETARPYIERELARGRPQEEIFTSEATQRGILDLQMRAERALRPNDVAFLDRALPDTLTFFRIVGCDPNQVLATCHCHRYASVAILDPLPFEVDGTRLEDDVYVGLLDRWLARDYTALGYDVLRVPALPPEERVAFLLDRLSEQGLV
ncbi:MAG: ATP-binding protein [Anaerolineae bacterium]|jgi:predicted ATPase